MTQLLARILVLPLALAAGAALANPATANLPKPKSGMWEMKTSIAEMGGMSMNFESCVDGTIEDMMKHPDVEDADCKDMKIEHSGNRVTARATCMIEGSKADIESVFTGDFTKSYRGEIRSTYTPPLHGMKTTSMNVEGRWIAPACAPGQKAGDTRMKGGVSVPGMGTIDLDSLMKNLPNAGR